MSSSFRTEPASLQPGDEVKGWRIVRLWRQDFFSVSHVVERGRERRLLRLARLRPDSLEGQRQERFLEREVGALRLVQHPSIPRLHEEGRLEDPLHGYRYLVTDHVEGPNFLEWNRKAGVTARRFALAAMQVAQAVAAMREKGLNHGSIRSENVLVQARDERPFLVDFSLASWPGCPWPSEGPVIGEDFVPALAAPAIPGKTFFH